MSIALMTEAWKLEMPTGCKFVLISLCDNANDHGECYPSISNIAKRCGMTERSVQRILAELESQGILTRQERKGRSNFYCIDLRHCVRGDIVSPRHCVTPGGDIVSGGGDIVSGGRGDIVSPITVIEPSLNHQLNHKTARGASISVNVFKVDDVDECVWRDFAALRKAKKSPLTKTAVDGIRLQAQKAGLSLEQALRTCCERGWSGFKAEWLKPRYSPLPTGSRSGSSEQTFAERDRETAMARWEQMTGQVHPDRAQKHAAVIDVVDVSRPSESRSLTA